MEAIILPQKKKIKNGRKNEMIKEYGEVGLLAYLSRQKGVKISSAEGNWKDIIKFVLDNGFKKEELAAWLMLNYLWTRNKNKRRQIKEADLEKAAPVRVAINKDLKWRTTEEKFWESVNKVMKKNWWEYDLTN